VSEATAAPGPDTVEQWIADTQDSDPKIRAAAIANLANAPTAQALPALSEVLDTGEPEVDRHIALRSLHALALRDGDKNGQVRDVMRRAIYHSDNDGVTQTAQSLLDDVEAAFAEQQPQPN
jgi:HEAT repeat protein